MDEAAQAVAGPRTRDQAVATGGRSGLVGLRDGDNPADVPESPAAGPRRHPARRIILGTLAVGVVAVVIILGRHTLAKSMHVLGDANLAWLLLALAAEVASHTAFGLSRTLLLRANSHRRRDALRVRFRSVMVVGYAGNALSMSVPFAGAELSVVYSYRELRRRGSDSATTSWAMAVSALFSTSALAVVLLIGAAVGGWSAGTAAALIGAFVYLIPGAGVVLALRYARVRALLHRVLAWLAELSRRMFGKPDHGADGLETFLDEVSSTRLSWPRYARVFGYAVANWLLDCAVLTCAIRAMGESVPWRELLLVYCAGAAVSSTGLNLGAVEVVMTTALTATGMGAAHALAAVLAYRLVNYWLVVAGGWLSVGVIAQRDHRADRGRRAGRDRPGHDRRASRGAERREP